MNNEIIYELVYPAVIKKTCEEKPQGRYKQLWRRGYGIRLTQDNTLLLALYS